MAKKKKVKSGGVYYKKAGLTKSMLLFLTPDLHRRLKALAEKEERTVQATARRILEERLGGKE